MGGNERRVWRSGGLATLAMVLSVGRQRVVEQGHVSRSCSAALVPCRRKQGEEREDGKVVKEEEQEQEGEREGEREEEEEEEQQVSRSSVWFRLWSASAASASGKTQKQRVVVGFGGGLGAPRSTLGLSSTRCRVRLDRRRFPARSQNWQFCFPTR